MKLNNSFSIFYYRKKLAELSTHKRYDDNMAHGFVTINIRHEPEIEKKLNQTTIHNEQLSIHEGNELPSAK